MRNFKLKDSFLTHSAKALILWYQRTLSPDHGFFKKFFPYGYCRFHPTCSEYGLQAIDRYGVFKGGYKAFFRVCRCHPWSQGGHDPLT